MNAPENVGRVVTPRGGMTAKAIEFIRQQVSARTDQIATHIGTDTARVAPLLQAYVKSGALVTCLVQVPGKRSMTEYRIGSGIPQGSGKGWKGEPFTINPRRVAKIGESLSAGQIAAARAKAPSAKTPAAATGSNPEQQREAPQPAVGQNTGSAPAPTPPRDGAHRAASAPEARAPATAKGADAIRLIIADSGEMVIALGDAEPIKLDPSATRQLGKFLAACSGLWSGA